MRIYRHHLYEGGSQEYLKELNVSAHENTEAEGMNHLFSIVGIQKPEEEVLSVKKKWYQGHPVLSWAILLLILLGCLFFDVIMTKDPTYMDLMNYNLAPNREFLFGTDTMGRDIFSMIWYGGRISLFIGLLSTVISTAIAVVFGGISGIAPQWLDTLLMRLTEILLSVPNLLLVILHDQSISCNEFKVTLNRKKIPAATGIFFRSVINCFASDSPACAGHFRSQSYTITSRQERPPESE